VVKGPVAPTMCRRAEVAGRPTATAGRGSCQPEEEKPGCCLRLTAAAPDSSAARCLRASSRGLPLPLTGRRPDQTGHRPEQRQSPTRRRGCAIRCRRPGRP
jgi:hypothetical protein